MMLLRFIRVIDNDYTTILTMDMSFPGEFSVTHSDNSSLTKYDLSIMSDFYQLLKCSYERHYAQSYTIYVTDNDHDMMTYMDKYDSEISKIINKNLVKIVAKNNACTVDTTQL